jgi:lysophospholipase L1-like esterase
VLRGVCVAAAVVVIGGCGSGDGKPVHPTAGRPRSLVVLGDAIAATVTPPCNCTAAAAMFGARIGARLTDLTAPGTTARGLLKKVRTDSFSRQVLRNADDIVIDTGINDLPWNSEGDPCSVNTNPFVIRWAGVNAGCIRRVGTRFDRTMNAVLTQIDTLRAGKPTLLRLITVYNARLGDTGDPPWNSPAVLNSPAAAAPSAAAVARFDAIQCRLASDHHGRCINLQKAFRASHGSRPARRFLTADNVQPSREGQRVIADLLSRSR